MQFCCAMLMVRTGGLRVRRDAEAVVWYGRWHRRWRNGCFILQGEKRELRVSRCAPAPVPLIGHRPKERGTRHYGPLFPAAFFVKL